MVNQKDLVKYPNGEIVYVVMAVRKDGWCVLKHPSTGQFYNVDPKTTKRLKKVSTVFSNLKTEKIISNPPAVIVFFNDGTKVVSKCHPNDSFYLEKGIHICLIKKTLGLSNQEYKQLMNRAYRKVVK